MRTLAHYQKMLSGNPSATIGFTLAADMVFAARHDIINRAEAHSTDEWKNIARNLKSQYGENLSVDEVQTEMSPEKTAAAILGRKGGSARSEAKTKASRENAKKGGWPKGRLRKNPKTD